MIGILMSDNFECSNAFRISKIYDKDGRPVENFT